MKDKINFFRLEKQNLLQKGQMKDYLELLDEHIGLHSTDYLTPYISMWARINDFEPSQMFHDLNERNLILRMRALRGTLFLVHKNNIELIMKSIDKIRTSRSIEASKYAPKDFDYELVRKAVIDILNQNPALQFSKIKKLLADKIDPKMVTFAKSTIELDGVIIRSKQRNILDKLYCYSLLSDIYPEINLDNLTYESAIEKIFTKYLTIFGPATIDDFSWWLPTNKTLIKSLIKSMSNLHEFSFDNNQYYMLKTDFKKYENFSVNDIKSQVFFLPYEDHYPKAYIKRDFFIDDYMIPNLFGVNSRMAKGEIRPSIWFNGRIIGRWEYVWRDKKKTGFNIEIAYLDDTIKISDRIRQHIRTLADELEQYLNVKVYPLIKT